MLLELMGELGAEPERTLMIGDTTHDLQLAANAGVACVASATARTRARTSIAFRRVRRAFDARTARLAA